MLHRVRVRLLGELEEKVKDGGKQADFCWVDEVGEDDLDQEVGLGDLGVMLLDQAKRECKCIAADRK